MPDTARITAKILCPVCGTPLLNSARFQWGEVPGLGYAVGEPIRWLRESNDQIVAPFNLRAPSPGVWRWNSGDPQCRRVMVFDEDVYPGNHELACTHCATEIAAIVAYIDAGVIREVLALTSADANPVLGTSWGKARVVMVREDGSHEPREDWWDHPIDMSQA